MKKISITWVMFWDFIAGVKVNAVERCYSGVMFPSDVQFCGWSQQRCHLLPRLRGCGPRWAASQLIICYSTVYQSQRISSCLRELWIFRLYGLINFPGIIRPRADLCFDECSSTQCVPCRPFPPVHDWMRYTINMEGSHCINQMCFSGCSSLHYQREGSLPRVCDHWQAFQCDLWGGGIKHKVHGLKIKRSSTLFTGNAQQDIVLQYVAGRSDI